MTKSKREIYPITSNPRNQTNDSNEDALAKRNPIIHPPICHKNKLKYGRKAKLNLGSGRGKLRIIMRRIILKTIILMSILVNHTMFASEPVIKFSDDQFEKIGIEHNDRLEKFFKKIISKEVIINDNQSYIQLVKENFIQGSESVNDKKIEIDKTSIIINPEIISQYRTQIQSIFNSTSTISELNSSIDAAISELKANNTITNGEYNCVMSMFFVAKHSAYFWYNSSEGGSGMGNSYIKVLIEMYPKIFSSGEEIIFSKASVKEIATEDALGAATGGVCWAAATVWTGAGTVGGFIYGLVSGAISSSAVAAAKGINMEPMCLAKEGFDVNCFNNAQNNSDLWRCMWDAYTDLLCCYITFFKPSYCDKYQHLFDKK